MPIADCNKCTNCLKGFLHYESKFRVNILRGINFLRSLNDNRKACILCLSKLLCGYRCGLTKSNRRLVKSSIFGSCLGNKIQDVLFEFLFLLINDEIYFHYTYDADTKDVKSSTICIK